MKTEELKVVSEYISKIREYDEILEKQNLWWTVVAMVGKINNQNMESQLLDSISNTQAQFDQLKGDLINSLVQRYLDKLNVEMKLKSQAFIDILNRNLFERTADVGFLAMDVELVSYMTEGQFEGDARADIELRLQEYVQKYSVYDNVVLLDPNLNLAASILPGQQDRVPNCDALDKALRSDDFVECDDPILGVSHSPVPLTYLQRIVSNGQVVGILCLCFKFDDELNLISKQLDLSSQKYNLFLVSEDDEQKFAFTAEGCALQQMSKVPLNQLEMVVMNGKHFFVYSAKAQGYQGFEGLPWRSVLMISAENALNRGNQLDDSLDLNQDSALFPNDLYNLNLEINTALLIVILNGKIISLKNNVKSFLPVLDSFQEIGTVIRQTFADSIAHIHHIDYRTLEGEVVFAANLSNEIMDRNLYERANDSRWWALSKQFRSLLSQPALKSHDGHDIAMTLKAINKLYTVYTNLFVYNSKGVVIAVSNDEASGLLGKSLLGLPEVVKSLKLSNSNHYAVSMFNKTDLYDGRSTYVYHGGIKGIESAIVGGIGVVFDSEVEFKEILHDCLPKRPDGSPYEDAFSMFISRHGKVLSISANQHGIEVGAILELPLSDVLQKPQGANDSVQLVYKGIEFLVGYHVTDGYREYKITDGYQNDIVCLVFVPC